MRTQEHTHSSGDAAAPEQTALPAERELRARLERTYARNMEAMARCRPAVSQAIVAAGGQAESRYLIGPESGNRLTIHRRDPDGRVTSLDPDLGSPPGAAPLQKYQAALAHPAVKTLCGIGDGAILDWLARHPVELPGGAQIAIHVCEPDPELVKFCLMVHDWTGPKGPIEDERFVWFVGADWPEQARRVMGENLMLPLPQVFLTQGLDHQQARGVWAIFEKDREAGLQADRAAAAQHAAEQTATELAELFGESPSRPPRVLMMTSRFTTVLQHSARDVVSAFTGLRWVAELVIENRLHEVINEAAVARRVAQFMPDLIFTIDHHRHEYACLPTSTPFVCWIQDNLDHLRAAGVGRRISERDFVIGTWVGQYASRFEYPARQCITIPRLTTARAVLPVSRRFHDDLAYVSNHSAMPEQALRELVAVVGGSTPGAKVIAAAGQRMIELYSSDQTLRDPAEVSAVILDAAARMAVAIPQARDVELIADMLFERLNNLLYRQQGLRWAARCAEERGLRLGVYGSGWENHPEFASLARGPVQYGDELAALTRSCRINLQLEPYSPTSHQRLIDGLAAGGFFLSRQLRTYERIEREWTAFFLDELEESVETLEAARAALDERPRARFEELRRGMIGAFPIFETLDIVRHFRLRQQQGTLVEFTHSPLPPRYFEVAFFDAREFGARLDRFLDNESLRQEIVGIQRRCVLEGFSYAARLKEVIRRIGGLLHEEAAGRMAGRS